MVNQEQIDAGADALRQRLQGGKKLRPWSVLPNSVKRKWRDYAAVVLESAFADEPRPRETRFRRSILCGDAHEQG